MPFAIIPQSAHKVKMRKLHIKRDSVLVEPANRPTETPSTDSNGNPVLETLAEIVCLLASSIVGWIAYVAF